MKKNMILCAAASAALLISGCGNRQNEVTVPDQDGSKLGYSLTFFKNVVAVSDSDENVFVSPYSAGVALSMLTEGATGETRDELVKALGGSTFKGDVLYADSLNDVRSANSLWLSSRFSASADYVLTLESSYKAKAATKDFSSPATVGEINNWCSENTEGRIPEIIDHISPDMAMFIINALYFKAPWAVEFNEDNTQDRVFHGSEGDKEVPMMFANERYGYASWKGGQLVRMQYKGSKYSMVVALPPTGMGVNEVVAMLTEDAYKEALGRLKSTKVALTMPKFKFETEYNLNDVLMAMGVKKAFSRGAEFGGITAQGVEVDHVKQKCFIEVNEKGSEAAAVTSVGLRLTSANPDMPAVMTVDRPFVFAIVDNADNEPLFIGRIMNL